MQRIKVAVLRGGPSSEHEISLKTGKSVIDNLPDKYIPIDVFIDRAGGWHIEGLPVKPEKVFADVAVVFNAMHGTYGEDGKIQQLLEQHCVLFTGSGALASAISMNKHLAKDIFIQHGIKTPIYKTIKLGEEIHDFSTRLFKSFPIPVVVKPNNNGSSLGVSIASTVPGIEKAITEAFKYSDTVIIEEFIKGREATCGVVDNFRDKDIYSLLPIEIKKPSDAEFFDYNAKYSGKSEEICPGCFSSEEKRVIQKMAADAHKVLGLKHYSRSDFIIHPKRGIYLLEVNTLPGLTSESLLPKSLKAIGCSFPDFLDHLITLALEKR